MAAIKIEILPLGVTRVELVQPRDPERADRLWQFYRRLRPKIDALEKAARAEARAMERVGRPS